MKSVISKRRLNFRLHIGGSIIIEALYANKADLPVMEVVATTVKLIFQSRLRTEDEDAILSGIRFLEDSGWKAKLENINWNDLLKWPKQ